MPQGATEKRACQDVAAEMGRQKTQENVEKNLSKLEWESAMSAENCQRWRTMCHQMSALEVELSNWNMQMMVSKF